MKKIFTFFLILFLGLTTFGQWVQQGVDINGDNNFHSLGRSVSLSSGGLIMAVASTGYQSRGLVRVFKLTGGTWVQQGADINGETNGDLSGSSISLSDDGLTIAIGATSNDDAANNAGHVRVFEYNGTNWIQKGADIDGEAISDASGGSVSLSSDGLIVAIGARVNDAGGTNRGHVRVYKYNGTSWIQQGIDIDGEADSDNFGCSVSLSSNGLIVAIGAYTNDGNGANAGHVRIFEYNGTNWIQQGIDIDGENAGDFSGISVSLNNDGLTVAIGGQGNDDSGSFAGHVRVYDYNGTSWIQKGLDIDGEAADDRSGGSVSLSADGLTVSIGARYNDGTGVDAGHVRVYNYDGSNWNQLGLDIDGEYAGDDSGTSVNISDDGSTVAIGATGNGETWTSSVQVRVYSFCAPGTSTDAQTACDSLVWLDGNTYNMSTNTPTFSITGGAANGCDSIITLNLTIKNSSTGTDIQSACESYTWINGITYNTSNFTATDTLVNSVGCDSIVTLNLTINNKTGTDVQSACESYTWIDGNTYTSSTNAPTFNIVGGASNGCDSIVTLNLTINTLPDNTTTTASLTITANQVGATYQWIDCNNGNSIISGETNATYTANTNGDYGVIVETNGCSDTSACINISTVGLNESFILNEIEIYPNPAQNNLTIQGNLENVSLKLTDLTGKKQEVSIIEKNTNSKTISLKDLPSGIYFVTLSSETNVITKKIIKQ